MQSEQIASPNFAVQAQVSGFADTIFPHHGLLFLLAVFLKGTKMVLVIFCPDGASACFLSRASKAFQPQGSLLKMARSQDPPSFARLVKGDLEIIILSFHK